MLGNNVVPMGLSNGVMGALPLSSLQSIEASQQALNAQQQPHIQGLAGHIRKAWEANKQAKSLIEQRMLQALRQRRGEYDPERLAEIRKTGGSDIYVMLTAAKCRSISAWLRDLMLSQGDQKPWSVQPTPQPTLPPDVESELAVQLENVTRAVVASGLVPGVAEVRQLVETFKDQAMDDLRQQAKDRVARAEAYMDDQLVEGGFRRALSQFIDDFSTFPSAVIKGPVVRKRRRLAWEQGPTGWTAIQKEELVPEWDRVDPFNLYPSAQAESVDDGDLIELVSLTRKDLYALIGVEGYSEEAIRSALEEHGRGGLREWTAVDASKAEAEGKDSTATSNPDKLIDALQYWGSVPGRILVEWGLDESLVPDQDAEYEVEAWLIGQWVIKAMLNPDVQGRRPYYKTSYEELPGLFWGNSPCDLVRDDQLMCNAAARALANNLGISSGPQVWINVDRLPPGEDLTNLFPWKIHQVVTDPMGSSSAPMGFFQPDSHAPELINVIREFSDRADEHVGIPKYMSGEAPSNDAGRTASGMSMLFSHASKVMKQAVANIDLNIIAPLIERLHDYNMQYGEDETIKGDLRVQGRGLTSITQKETAQVRRNEVLAATNNPVDLQIIGLEGRAALLRETVKDLDVNVDKIVPDPARMKAKAQLQQLISPAGAPGAAPQMGGVPPQPSLPAPEGAPSPSGQTLMTGAPVTDNFSPPTKPEQPRAWSP